MNCPYCTNTQTKKRAKKTKLRYATFFCLECQCLFNERTGTPFNYLEAPTDIVLLVVFWCLRYKLSLRDVAEMFLARGFVFTHETVRDWEERYYPMRGFKTFEATARFCCAFDELRNYLRPRRTMGEPISLPEQRRAFLHRLAALKALIQAASWQETNNIEAFNESAAFLCSQF